MKRCLTRLCALPLYASFCLSANAAVVLEGTRIVQDAGRSRDVTIRSTNAGDQPALTQVWIDDGDSHARPETVRTPFRMTPAEPRLLKPHEGQAWRITYAPRPSDPPLPADRESLFYFNLLDIPPKPTDAQDGNLLQFAVRSRIKLFHRPAGLRGSVQDAAASLRWQLRDHALHVENPSAYHVTLTTLTLADGTALEADMIAPYATQVIALPSALPASDTLGFTWLDDYGAARSAEAVIARKDNTSS